MKCFYHMDNDGKCSGAIVRREFPKCEMIPIDYNIPFPLSSIAEGETVFIVDFSIEPEMMSDLLQKTKNVVWIDHHLSAIEKYTGFTQHIKGIREDGTAGCRLTWRWIHQGTDKENNMPWAVKYIADWDTWQHNGDPMCLNFNAGLGIYDTRPESGIWETLLSDDINAVDQICKAGHIIRGRQKQIDESFCKHYGYETEFEGHLCFAINRPKPSSIAFESVKDKYDVFIGYVHNGSEYIFSIYTDTEGVNVKEIAEKYGGGGHLQAAGWHSKEIPFEPKVADINGQLIDTLEKMEE